MEINSILEVEKIANEEIKSLFVEAESLIEDEEYIRALFLYNDILNKAPYIDDVTLEYKGYMGMYLSWVTYCKKIKKDSMMLSMFFDNVIRYANEYATREELEKYLDIYKENLNELQKKETNNKLNMNDDKIKDLLNKAENFKKNNEFLKSLSCYDKIITLGENEDAIPHDIYFKLYLTWYDFCKFRKAWCFSIDAAYKLALKNAPQDKKDEYKKIYNENLKSFKQKISNK